MPSKEINNSISKASIYLIWIFLSIFGGCWWLFEKGTFGYGTFFIIATWIMVLNQLSNLNWKSFNETEIKYFGLPLACIATIGYIYGIIYHYV